jgi:hypothetical protein
MDEGEADWPRPRNFADIGLVRFPLPIGLLLHRNNDVRDFGGVGLNSPDCRIEFCQVLLSLSEGFIVKDLARRKRCRHENGKCCRFSFPTITPLATDPYVIPQNKYGFARTIFWLLPCQSLVMLRQ